MSNSVWFLSVRKKEIVFKKYPSKSKKKIKKKSTKKIMINLFFALMLILFSGLVSAALTDDLHVNIQTTDSSGDVYTGTFNFSFKVATDSACANVVYHNWSLITTDNRGIISYYIPSVNLDYDVPYWLCSYRYNTDNTLNSTDILKIARTPYAFRATDINLSEVEVDSNLTMDSYNVSASWGFFDYLGSLLDRVVKLFVTDIDFTGYINGSGNVTTTGNVTANYFFGNGTYITGIGDTGSYPIYVNLTTSTYNGSLVDGSNTGYNAGNSICNSEFSGSHLCTEFEITGWFAKQDSPSVSGDAWVTAGGPKYVPASIPVNDCNGWTHGSAGTYLGNYWHFNSTTGGDGRAINCGTALKLACCSYNV